MRRLLIAALVLASLPGCGTIMLRPRQVVEVTSRPPDATVTLEGTEQSWQTPARFRLWREGGPHRLVVSKPGYRSRSITLRQEISEWTWLGAMVTLGIGYFVDWLTGSRYDLEPQRVDFDLLPSDAPRPAGQ